MNETEQRIKCGKCNSEFSPRAARYGRVLSGDLDYSCPLCGHGKRDHTTEVVTTTRTILKD